MFGLGRNAKGADFSEEICKMVWDRLASKYAPHTATSLLKLKSEIFNTKLEFIEKDPDE